MDKPISQQIQPFNHTSFNAFLNAHRLMAARCTVCGAIYLPPRPLCGQCYNAQMEWVELSGEGELAGYTIIAVGLPEMIAEGYTRSVPYCVGVVRLKEGPSISGQLVDIDCAHPEGIKVGMPVRAAYIERGQGENRRVILAFEKR